MGCFSFNSRSKSHPVAGCQDAAVVDGRGKSGPASDSGQQQIKAFSASTPTRSILELSDERAAQRLRVFDLDELGTNGFSRALKAGGGRFGCVYCAFFHSSTPPVANA